MNLRQPLMLAGLMTAANAAIGAWAYAMLPANAQIAINYNDFSGHHATMPKLAGLVVFPAVSTIVTTALGLAPLRARLPKGLEASASAYGLLITSLAALFLVTEGALIARAMDPDFDVLRWVFLACAVLLILVGNTLGKVRHNDIFGVRTPWTLADARLWDKTHRFTGRLMVLAALALAAVAAVAPDHRLLVVALVLAAAGPLVAGAVYSWVRQEAPKPG